MSPFLRNWRSWLLACGAACLFCGCNGADDPSQAAQDDAQVNTQSANDSQRTSASTDAEDDVELTPQSQQLFVEFQKEMQRRNWDRAAESLAQIHKLEAGNLAFVEFRAFHLAYNIGAEQETAADVYRWKKAGIEALLDGLDDNQDHPRLLVEVGWHLGPGLGRLRGPELRRLFAADPQLHQRLLKYLPQGTTFGPDNRPDCWLASQAFYLRAIAAEQKEQRGYGNQSEMLVFLGVPMSHVNYAVALQEDGRWEDSAAAWQEAERLFHEFSGRLIRHPEGESFRLSDDSSAARLSRRIVDLDSWLPRCRLERDPRAIRGRRLLHEATQPVTGPGVSFAEAAAVAMKRYRDAFALWTELLADYPDCQDNDGLAGSLQPAVNACRKTFGESLIPPALAEFCDRLARQRSP